MYQATKQRRRPDRHEGFTLIELLVVISIIALVISILLPSLASARRAAEKVACMAQLRGAAQAGVGYSTDNESAMVGAPSTSGATTANGFAVGAAVQNWDFLGPMAEVMGLGIPLADGTADGMKKRFNAIRSSPAFLCRSNRYLAISFPGSGSVDAGTGRMVSFNTCRMMLTRVDPTISDEGQGVVTPGSRIGLPAGYAPKIDKIGVPANKVFFADGSRYSAANSGEGIIAPDYNLSANASYGGAFSDSGAFANFSNSWDRARAPGNGYIGRTDGRVWAYRHNAGDVPVGAPANAYKLNLVFFDGHAETQGDLESTNPHQWLPQGTVMGITNFWRDTILHFGLRGAAATGVRIGG